MKIQCSCGAKYSFEVTPDLAQKPAHFVCPACGLDVSDYLNELVRQELGASGPVVAIETPAAGSSAPPLRVRVNVPVPAAAAAQESSDAEGRPCPKHPAEWATEKCYVCSKPICPKCMEIFGYVCSPLCRAKANSHGIEVPVYERQQSVVEARQWRATVWAATAVAALVAVALGFWVWYKWFGSTPKEVFSVRLPGPVYSGQSQICSGNQIVFLHGGMLARYDMPQKKQIWSRELVDPNVVAYEVAREMKANQEMVDRANNQGREHVPKIPSKETLLKRVSRSMAAELELRVRGSNVWVLSPRKVVRYDWGDGRIVKEVPLNPTFGGVMSHGDQLLMATEEAGKPMLTRINLTTCDLHTEEIGGQSDLPPAEGHRPGGGDRSGAGGEPALAGLPTGMPGRDAGKPMDPAKVAEQAQHLSLPAKIALPAVLANSRSQERTLSEMDSDSRGNRSGNGRPSEKPEPFELIPARDGYVEFSAKMIEEKIVSRSAMRPAASKSVLDGPVNVTQSAEVANEMLNEMQRERGGEYVEEDMSRYKVSLKSIGSASGGWTGEVIGSPQIYPLETVTVLAAKKRIIVFDKTNKLLWESTLNYPLEAGMDALDADTAPFGRGPCVERKDTLYMFDEGVLTAFDLATGNVRWRVPSVGIAGLFFDDQGMLYVNTTTAGPQGLRFSRQIDISAKTSDVVLKLDPRTGKTLWSAEPGGLACYVSGKFIYTMRAYMPDDEDEDGNPYQPETGFDTLPFLKLKRLNPKNGREMWEHFQQRGPLDVQFDKNVIRLVFKKEVQVLKFLTF